jgi:hypothetical protein
MWITGKIERLKEQERLSPLAYLGIATAQALHQSDQLRVHLAV